MTDAPLRIGLWCAVSSKAQATEDKISLADQEHKGREFAAAVGGEVVAIYSVPGHTRDIWRWDEAERQMPAYALAREDIEAGAVDVLFCVSSDRLGRDPALIQQFYSLAQRHGVELYNQEMPHQLGAQTIGHRYGIAVGAVAAGEDQKRRAARHRMGMKGRIEKRGLLPGLPPFYLDPVREPLTGAVIGYEFNEMVGALDLMTRLFLGGHSYAEIRRRLDESPYPPPGNNARWWHRTIQDVLGSDVPAGLPSWGPFRAQEPSGRVPVRWDADTHAAVVKERQRRSRYGYHRKGSGPLSGVAFCNRCGGSMTRHAKPGGYYYLRCNRHAARSVYPHYECHPNYIPEAKALQAVADFLAWLVTPEAIEQALSDLGDGQEAEQAQQELGRLESTITDIEQRKVRLGHAFAAGDMEITVYRQVNEELTARLEAVEAEAALVRAFLDGLPDLDERREALFSIANNFGEALASREPPEIATMLHEAGIRVYCESGEVVRIRLG